MEPEDLAKDLHVHGRGWAGADRHLEVSQSAGIEPSSLNAAFVPKGEKFDENQISDEKEDSGSRLSVSADSLTSASPRMTLPLKVQPKTKSLPPKVVKKMWSTRDKLVAGPNGLYARFGNVGVAKATVPPPNKDNWWQANSVMLTVLVIVVAAAIWPVRWAILALKGQPISPSANAGSASMVATKPDGADTRGFHGGLFEDANALSEARDAVRSGKYDAAQRLSYVLSFDAAQLEVLKSQFIHKLPPYEEFIR